MICSKTSTILDSDFTHVDGKRENEHIFQTNQESKDSKMNIYESFCECEIDHLIINSCMCVLPVSHKMLVTKCDRRTPSEARH